MPKSSTSFSPGKSGNPGGRPSAAKAIERATRLLTASEREAIGLGPDEPLTVEWVAAKTMKSLIMVGVLPPLSGNDANWRHATTEIANRIWGKAKETVEIVEAERDPEVDWAAVPLEDRKRLLAAMDEIASLAATSAADEAAEH